MAALGGLILTQSLVLESHHDTESMKAPLVEYYVLSSHNTCMEGHQFFSNVRPEMFDFVLLQGGRCIELDLWDGPEQMPVLAHGPTTQQADLTQVLRHIKASAFVASPYPVILSLDNNCSTRVQVKVAIILEQELGEALVLPDHPLWQGVE